MIRTPYRHRGVETSPVQVRAKSPRSVLEVEMEEDPKEDPEEDPEKDPEEEEEEEPRKKKLKGTPESGANTSPLD
ncbi:hypothetical protein Tco_0740749 [Tanacetum coccineum]